MQLLVPTTTFPSRLALVLVLALLSYCASAAPHPDPGNCGTPNNNECASAGDCCPFSYCQAQLLNNGKYHGVSDDLIQHES